MKAGKRILSFILTAAILVYPIAAYAEEGALTETIITEEITEETIEETNSETETVGDSIAGETEVEASESLTESEVSSPETVQDTESEVLLETEFANESVLLASPDDCVAVPVSGIKHYDYAYRALEVMNEMRAEYGYPALGMNKTLQQDAMLCSAELTLLFDGLMRPNGMGTYGSIQRYGFCGWLREDFWWLESYLQYQVINPTYNSVGIGCFENNGMYYWKIIFEERKGTSVVITEPETTDVWVDIKADRLKYTSGEDTNISLYPGWMKQLSVYQYYDQDGTAPKHKSFIRPGLLQWTSSNPKVAEIDGETGELTAVSGGDAVIRAKYNNNVVCQWNVSVIKRIQVVNPQVTYKGPKEYHMGEITCPDDYKKYLTVAYKGKTLTDEDYNVTGFETGPNAVLYSFTLEFCGDYSGTYKYSLPVDEPSPSEDYQKVRAFVERLYKEILGRSADPSGLNAWTDVLYSGEEQGAKVAQGFIDSAELKKRNLSDDEYIRALYRTFFNREADSSGLAAWKKVLDSGLSRMHVFRGFAESNEFTKICDSYGIIRGYADLTAPMDQNEGVTKFIVRSYRLCLNREADEAGLNEWCKAILSKRNTAKEAAHGFVFSNEFLKKNLSDKEYIKVLYRVFMDREADAGGLSAWEKVLKDGKSREHVFNGFADSPEFRKICQSYGIE